MISEKIAKSVQGSSWIRAMFEEGEKLAKIHGRDKVYDFSIGNPFAEPPTEVIQALQKYVSGEHKGIHRYMSNAGYPDVREKIAKYLQQESGIELTAENIVMTVGAAGGLNVVFKTLLNPGDEVVVFAPYFVEYNSYVDNHGGKTVIVPPNTTTFEPDLEALAGLITAKTKAILINSPNNPSGVVYSENMLRQTRELLAKKEKEYNTTIYVVSDEPYSKIIYDDCQLPSILAIFENSLVVNSFSKSLGLAGARIGYIAASSRIKDSETVNSALAYCNRILGFVNAPGLFQKVVADGLEAKVDIEDYKQKRDFLYDNLQRLGFECLKPQGAFYLFPKALIEDDIEFTQRALKYNLLLVPGTGFGCPGYFRMSYCISMETIVNSIPAWEKLAEEFR
ncbi:MAG: pyridoxal phosphate-dependent aminotransferase [Peptococcaceae bacterium]|nr:pyridoxal phosphate-dependent aminotransferase [Peptococcaceae bacterium]